MQRKECYICAYKRVLLYVYAYMCECLYITVYIYLPICAGGGLTESPVHTAL